MRKDRRKQGEGGRKEGRREGVRENQESGGGLVDVALCGPGGELPNPGCSAETSMGGCVGSHHDSSGSLNENSDGTGGNLTGLKGFRLELFFLITPQQPDRAGDRQSNPADCTSTQRGLKARKESFMAALQTRCNSQSYCFAFVL